MTHDATPRKDPAEPAEPAMLDEDEIERLAHAREIAVGFRDAARRALSFARRYRTEEGAAGGAREVACIAQAQAWRQAARDLRASLPTSATAGVRPGLARAREKVAVDGRKTG